MSIDTCYATFDEGVLRIGSQHLERTWRWRDGKLFAVSLWIKKTNRNWIAKESEVASLCAREAASGEPAFHVRRDKDGPLERESLIVELQHRDRTLRFKLFPDSASVTMQLLHRGASVSTAAAQQPTATGVEEPFPKTDAA